MMLPGGGRARALGLLALVLAAAHPLAAETTWYESDTAGFMGKRLQEAPSLAGREGWLLAVLRLDDGREQRELYEDGQLRERRLAGPADPASRRLASAQEAPSGSRLERIWKDGRLDAENLYAADGLLLEERVFTPAGDPPTGRLAETRSYAYEGKRLARMESRDEEGAIVGVLDHRYDAAGRLSEVRATGTFGSSTAGLLPSTGGPRASWTKAGELELIVVYDKSGRVVLAERRLNGEPVERDTWGYDRVGNPATSSSRDLVAGTLEERRLDAAGRVLSAVTKKADGDIMRDLSRVERSWDAAGRMILERTQVPGKIIERRLSYGEDTAADALPLREDTMVNGRLETVITRSPDGSRVEEYYAGGQLFVRAIHQGNRLIREEFYANGRLIRVKEAP